MNYLPVSVIHSRHVTPQNTTSPLSPVSVSPAPAPGCSVTRGRVVRGITRNICDLGRRLMVCCPGADKGNKAFATADIIGLWLG